MWEPRGREGQRSAANARAARPFRPQTPNGGRGLPGCLGAKATRKPQAKRIHFLKCPGSWGDTLDSVPAAPPSEVKGRSHVRPSAPG